MLRFSNEAMPRILGTVEQYMKEMTNHGVENG